MSTDIDPEITEGEIILKDRFLTQSAPKVVASPQTQVFKSGISVCPNTYITFHPVRS